MVVVVDGECAFEQRVETVSSNDDACPSDLSQRTFSLDQPAVTLVHFVLRPVEVLGTGDVAVQVKVVDRGVVPDDVMIWLEVKLDMLTLAMQPKIEVES